MAAVGKEDARKRRCAALWSALLPDIVHLISTYLTSTWDFVRFRGVCSSWRSAASPADRPPQIPCLLLPYDRETSACSFLDPSDRRIHTVYIPEARWKTLCGTAYGWLVMIGNDRTINGPLITVSLLNPITRAQILLPPITKQAINLTTSIVKAVLSANPLSSLPPVEVFLAILIGCSVLCVCKLGETETWKVMDLYVRRNPNFGMVDLAYFDGALFVLDRYKGITVYTIITGKKKYIVPPLKRSLFSFDSLHLVESSGDLLLLHRIFRRCNSVEVFKLDRSNKRKFKWVSIQESIGGRAFFVSCTHTSISLSSSYFTVSSGDLIYFAGIVRKGNCSKGASMCISDIVTARTTERKPNYWEGQRKACEPWELLNGLTWIVPSPC